MKAALKVLLVLHVIACQNLNQPISSTDLSSGSGNTNLTRDEIKIVDPCNLLDTAIANYVQGGGSPDAIEKDPRWAKYFTDAKVYVKKVRDGYSPPNSDRCGGPLGPPVLPGFKSIPADDPKRNVSARIVCLGSECDR
jgi:hypothetical protein